MTTAVFRLYIFPVFVLLWVFSPAVNADIYEWTDEHGVSHYSNFAPPEGARIVQKTKELLSEEPSDQDRLEAQREDLAEVE